MSSLLEQAIIDATALKEAAIKNAETAILNKYSSDIKEAVESLLEQEEADLGDLGAEAPAEGAAEDVHAEIEKKIAELTIQKKRLEDELDKLYGDAKDYPDNFLSISLYFIYLNNGKHEEQG